MRESTRSNEIQRFWECERSCQEAALHRKLSWKKLKWLRNAQRRGLGAERGVTPDAERAAYERWIDARRRLVAAHAKLMSYYHTDSDPRMRNRPATTESFP